MYKINSILDLNRRLPTVRESEVMAKVRVLYGRASDDDEATLHLFCGVLFP